MIVGDVGELQGGVGLLPAADRADGLLDVAVLGPTGLWGRARLAGRVLSGTRQDVLLERFRVGRLELQAWQPQPYELDDDLQAEVSSLVFEVEPAVLSVRVPR